MDPLWIEIGLIALLIIMGSIFAASEVAILSVRPGRLRELAGQGVGAAKVVLDIQRDPDRLLATVEIGRSIAITLAAVVAGFFIVPDLESLFARTGVAWIETWNRWISLASVVFVLSYLVIVFGELVPKSIALKYPETLSLILGRPVKVCSAVFYVVGKVFTGSSNLVLKIFRDQTSFSEAKMSEEEFKLLLEEGTKAGIIDKTEHELIKRVFEFTDTTAKEIMVPRPDVVAVELNTSREQLIKKVIEEGYTRLPVYRDTIDNVVGVVYSKDLIALLEHRDVIVLQDILRPSYFVPESIKISRLLGELQRRKVHLAVVIDEFGGTEGVVTMEDVLEEIVGEIQDEYDEELKEYERREDGSLLVNARVSVREFNAKFGTQIPEDEDYETLSGFLSKLTGRIPEQNESIQYKNIVFNVVKKSKRRIRQVGVRTKDSADRPLAEDIAIRGGRP